MKERKMKESEREKERERERERNSKERERERDRERSSLRSSQNVPARIYVSSHKRVVEYGVNFG
jgi:hypothetical protein